MEEKNIKLHYFNVYSRGEPIRMILHYNKVQFEDIRINPAHWGEKKNTYPNGKLPLLEIDGKQMTQSRAILRYLAQLYGQYPTDIFELYQAESVLDFVEDITYSISPLFLKFMRDPEKKTDAIEEHFKNILPGLITPISNLLKQNTTGSGFFIGKSITIADFAVVNFATRFLTHPDRVALSQPILDANPEFAAYIKEITESEFFKVYLSNRKLCAF